MDLGPGETLLFDGHPSWRSILGFYVKGLLVAVVAGAISRLAGAATGIAVAIALAILSVVVLVGLLKRVAVTYEVSDQRLWIRRGLLSRAVQETRLTRVQGVNTHQSFLQRVLRIGTVEFDTAAGDDYDFAFVGVANPGDISRRVDEAIRAMPVHG
jgi:uncharacterized membrane protein YdbT with pleckstrin-like domain